MPVTFEAVFFLHIDKYFPCLNITKLRPYDKGWVNVSPLCCNHHIVLATVMYVVLEVIGNLPNQSFRYEDGLGLWDFGLKTELNRN